ncbi:MAG: ABC transporter substrate-binding protein [Dehalococcoidia bacterium]|nr:ABC transporter substrate-binding protein [Dehalococcoidia bacterium]
MSTHISGRRTALLFGTLIVLLFTLACAKGEKAAAPAQTSAPVAAPAPTPAATTAPATPAAPSAPQTPRPATPTGPTPLVPGGPPFDRAGIEKTTFWAVWNQYHQTKIPLWTKAKYGGELRSVTAYLPTTQYNPLKQLGDHRALFHGALLNIDYGLCSLQNRNDDYTTCPGKYANNYNRIITPSAFIGWEQPNATTYIFRLRKGVLWPAIPPMARQDREVTSADIAWMLDIIKNEGALAPYFALVTAFEAVDRYTVKITLSAPHAEFMVNMANVSLALFARECYEEKDCLVNKQVTPAPFLFKSGTPRGSAVFEKNPEFYMKGLPYLDRFKLFGITDPAAQKAAFFTGNVTVIHQSGPPRDLEEFKKQVPGVKIIAATIFNGQAMRPQLTGPLADVRVRRALAMTMDHVSLWEVAYGGYAYLPTLVSRHTFGDEFFMTLEQAGEWYQFNPTRAKQLLTEAGYPDGFTTTFTTSSSFGALYDMLLMMQANWKKHLNVTANLKRLDATAATAALYAGQWEGLYPMGCYIPGCWGGGDEPFLQMIKGAPLNFQKIDDPKINDLYLKQRSELDPGKRAALLWEYEQYELTQLYAIRYSGLMSFLVKQPYSLNCAPQQMSWCGDTDSPMFVEMHDYDNTQK